MKKLISFLLLVLLAFTGLSGCSSSSEEKSEEELRAKIKAELEAEMASEKEDSTSEADMKDMDALYDYVKKEFPDLSRKDFDLWEVSYLDVTGDGSDEVIFAGVYGLEWPQKMQIITGDSGEYKRIPSDIALAPYENTLGLQDGFFTVKTRTGGTGEQFTYLDIYIYNGSQIVKILDSLQIEHKVAFPDAVYSETAQINGSLKDFEYILNRYDDQTGKENVVKKAQFIYNPKTMRFDEIALQTQEPSGSKGETSESVQNYVSSSDLVTEQGEAVRLSGLSSETIRGVQIDYSKFSAVIIPFYPSDGKNISSLESFPYVDNIEDPFFVEFAVLGKLEDVVITCQESMEADPVNNAIGELINRNVTIHGNLPTDMSYYKITGKVHTGEGYYEDVSFTLDSMRDVSEYEVYTIK